MVVEDVIHSATSSSPAISHATSRVRVSGIGPQRRVVAWSTLASFSTQWCRGSGRGLERVTSLQGVGFARHGFAVPHAHECSRIPEPRSWPELISANTRHGHRLWIAHLTTFDDCHPITIFIKRTGEFLRTVFAQAIKRFVFTDLTTGHLFILFSFYSNNWWILLVTVRHNLTKMLLFSINFVIYWNNFIFLYGPNSIRQREIIDFL